MRIRVLLCILFICCGMRLHAQKLPDQEGVYANGIIVDSPGEEILEIGNIFASHGPLKIEIESNFERLFAYKDDPDYQKGMMAYWMRDTLLVAKKTKIKVRGDTRTTICEYPPIRLDVKRTKFNPSWVDDLQSTKMVLPCKEGNKYDQFLAKEYLAYRMYNLLTDFSFNVRMAQFNFIDTDATHNMEINGFFIERDKLVENRLGLKEVKYEDLSPATLSKKLYLVPDSTTTKSFGILALFQFMIGNTDWAANNYHNIKVFARGKEVFAVPYDFDYSGLVDAHYAVSSVSLPIDEVTERHYLGPCTSPDQFDEIASIFLQKQQEIHKLIEQDIYLSKRSKTNAAAYVDSFYDLLLDTDERDKIRRTNCKVITN